MVQRYVQSPKKTKISTGKHIVLKPLAFASYLNPTFANIINA